MLPHIWPLSILLALSRTRTCLLSYPPHSTTLVALGVVINLIGMRVGYLAESVYRENFKKAAELRDQQLQMKELQRNVRS